MGFLAIFFAVITQNSLGEWKTNWIKVPTKINPDIGEWIQVVNPNSIDFTMAINGVVLLGFLALVAGTISEHNVKTRDLIQNLRSEIKNLKSC